MSERAARPDEVIPRLPEEVDLSRVLLGLLAIATALALASGGSLIVAGALLAVSLITVMLAYPTLGLFIVVFVTFGFPWEVLRDTLGSLGSAVRITAVLVVAAYVLRVLYKNERIRLFSSSALPVALFIGWRLIQIFRTHAPEAAVWIRDPGSISEFLLRLVMYLGLCVLLLNLCRTAEQIGTVTLAVVLPVLLSSLYSLLILAGLAPSILGSEHAFQNYQRIAGLRGNAGEGATISVVAIGLVLPFLFAAPKGRAIAAPLRVLLSGRWKPTMVVSITVVGLFLTGSRAGVLALIVLVFGNLLTNRAQLLRILPVVGIAGILILFAAPLSPGVLLQLSRMPILYELMSGQSLLIGDSSAAGRFERLTVVPAIIRDRPLMGAGYGNYELEMVQVLGYGSSAHNLYAEILGEEGIIGLAIYLFLLAHVFLMLRRSARDIRARGDPIIALLCVGFMWSFVAFNMDRVFSNGDALNKLVFLYIGMSDVFAQYARRMLADDGRAASRSPGRSALAETAIPSSGS